MPIKTYVCLQCGEKFERVYLSRDAYESAFSELCPECGDPVPVDENVPLVARRNPAYGIQN